MKLLIDIPDEAYNSIKGIKYYIPERRSGKRLTATCLNALAKGTPLKDKTNGEVIRTLFQYNDFSYNLSEGRKNIYFTFWHPDDVKIQCPKEWWNELYKENNNGSDC